MTETSQQAAPGRAGGTGSATRPPWLLVARREIMAKLTDKAFLVGTLVTLTLVLGFMGWQIWSETRVETHTLAAAAPAADAAQAVADRAHEVDDSLRVELVEVEDAAAGVAAVEAGAADVLLRTSDDGWTLVGGDDVAGDLERTVSTIVREVALATNAAQAGTSVEELQQGSEVDTVLLDGDAERQEFAEVMGFALAFLFYLAALGFGYTLAGSVVEEKASRIVEIIVTKIPVRQLLIGKIVGNTVLAIGQMAVMVSIGLVGLSFTDYASFLPAASAGMGWFAAFFLVGFGFIACWWAVTGALASRAEDLQTTATPLTFVMMGVFFASFLADGTVRTVASYLPPFSCVLMPIRLLGGDAAWWEPVVALVLLALAMAATIVLAERLYRRALLQTQGRVTLRQAWSAPE